MALQINTVCSRCGKSAKDFPGKVWSFRIGPPVVCFICEPPQLEGACPTCDGHGMVNLFEAWAALNHVIPLEGLNLLQEKFSKCRTRTEARKLLEQEKMPKGYSLLPDWLPE